jgi:hypothetical protein
MKFVWWVRREMGKVPTALKKFQFKKGSTKAKKKGAKGGRKSRPGGRKRGK